MAVISVVAIAFMMFDGYQQEFPNEPLESSPKNIAVVRKMGPASAEELNGLTRFRATRG